MLQFRELNCEKFRSSNFSITLKGCFRVKNPFFVFGTVYGNEIFLSTIILIHYDGGVFCVIIAHMLHHNRKSYSSDFFFLSCDRQPRRRNTKVTNGVQRRLVTQFVVRLYNRKLRTAINYFGQQKITFLFRNWDALTVPSIFLIYYAQYGSSTYIISFFF